jgi:DNA-binding CsgD family transcriptional regulator
MEISEAAVSADGVWSRRALLDQVLDEVAYGVAVATPDGLLLHANRAARQELASQRTLFERNGRLRAHAAEDATAMLDALGRAAAGKRSLLHLGTTDGAKFGIAIVPVRRSRPSDPEQAAVLFSRATVCESLMLCFFARSHALTPTEERVLAVLCQGHSAPEAAQRLQVAVSTVRSHVRSLCAKTRCSGVRELVRRVAMLPPVAPALRLDSFPSS